MSDQANALRGLMERRHSPPAVEPEPIVASKLHTIAVTSGKGGVGKSNIALNLAIALAGMDASVCLLDANLGLGNIDLLCGLNGYWNLSHVITGARALNDIVLKGPGHISVIPGASGLNDMADCPPSAQQDIFSQLEDLEQAHDFLIIDTGTGIHRSVRQFVTLADVVLIVSTPEPTSIADAYATIKSLCGADVGRMEALVNQADSPRQAQTVIERLQQTARLFLETKIESAGLIPRDHHVGNAVAKRTPLLIDSPHSPAARAIRQLARRLKTLAGVQPSRGAFFPRIRQRYAGKAA